VRKEIADKWVKALRSGEYTQGVDFLHRADGSMCCLGVLCDIYLKENPKSHMEWEWAGDNYAFVNNLDDPQDRDCEENRIHLPTEVMEWAGMDSNWGRLSEHIPNMPEDTLPGLNDSGKSFLEIADVIEAKAEIL
jgi:hypothetical protein